jgi:hypothetical protein
MHLRELIDPIFDAGAVIILAPSRHIFDSMVPFPLFAERTPDLVGVLTSEVSFIPA